MPRVGLDTEAVVAAAAELADAEGLEPVTLVRLAAHLGVRPPSLYVHVGGLSDLRARLAARGALELADALQAAAVGRAQGEALAVVAGVYRTYARDHPGTYAAMQRAADVPDVAAARVVDVFRAVLRGYGLQDDEAIHATRVVRAALHGFVALEATDGFGLPLDVDESFARLVATLDRGLATAPGRGR